MENQSAKRRGDGDGDGDGSLISIDRLSELPQPTLHQILSLVSQKEAIQTCVLSKSWRYIGSTRPKLEFSEGCLPWKGEPISVVDKTLKRYHDLNLSIQEFLLDVPGGVQSRICSYLEKWVSMLISLGGLKSFSLKFVSERYALPQVVFLAESLQQLNLYGCSLNKISSAQKVMFKNLQTLCLRYVVGIEEETFENIISGCPVIQCLIIYKCKGLRTIKVSNAHNLKNFDCNSSYVIHRAWPVELEKVCPSIEIDAPTNLQSIRIEDFHIWHNNNNNKFFPNLKSVYMNRVRVPEESFDIFSSYNCPCLEDLEISYCYGFEEIELSSSTIKRLIIQYNSVPSMSAAIDTPNILYFKFSPPACSLPSPFSFTKTSSCEWKSDISVTCYSRYMNDDVLSTWLLKLNLLLKTLSQSQISLDIGFPYIRNHRFEEGSNEPVAVEHLSLRGHFPSSYFPDLLNYLFNNVCRPRYIYDSQIKLENEGKKTGLESLCKVLVEGIERMDCLWQQDLEEISTEELKDASDDDTEEQRLRFLDSSLSKIKIQLRLKWKEKRCLA